MACVYRTCRSDGCQESYANQEGGSPAFQNQIEGRGFSFVEILTACPAMERDAGGSYPLGGKKHDPVFPLKVFKDRDGKAEVHSSPPAAAAVVSGKAASTEPAVLAPVSPGAVARGEIDGVALILSGFGGQGVLFSGLALAEGD